MIPEVKPEETLQEYINRAIAEGFNSIPALIANYNKK